MDGRLKTRVVDIMTPDSMKAILAGSEYDFLCNRPELGDNIIMIGVGGSHAYGTNVDGSDLDIRGIATNSDEKIILCNPFDQSVDVATDTTIYSFDKIISLLCNCNPNIVEILGLKPEHYLYINSFGKLILANKCLFLSKRAIHSFGGYANSQLRRLENKASKTASQEQEEKFILRSIESARVDFQRRYFDCPEDAIRLYIDKSIHDGYDTEIFMDVVLNHYPLRDYKDMISEMQSIVKSYKSIGRRNENAISHGKIAKHMMHLVRLYLMCHDILADGKIVTFREKDHDLLMDIRNGKFLDENDQPIHAFYQLVDELENDLGYWREHTDLPDAPDMKKINRLLYEVNERICRTGNNQFVGDTPFMMWRNRLIESR